MFAITIRNSLFISLLKRIEGSLCSTELWLGKAYKDSRIHRLTQVLWTQAVINFKYSFLGRISEIKEERNILILNNSGLAKCLLNLYNTWRLKIMGHKRTSTTVNLTLAFKRNIYFYPVKTVSIIIVNVILANTIFSILLNKDIALLGWIIRGMLLFAGLVGSFCEVGWKDLVGTSLFLKWINRTDSEGQ